MASCWITSRQTSSGTRFRVMLREGGRASNPRYGGSFKTRREAAIRRDAIMAQLAAGPVVFNQQGNPLNELLWLADRLVARQERELGEALPHLYVALIQIRELHHLASAEIAQNPTVFEDAA